MCQTTSRRGTLIYAKSRADQRLLGTVSIPFTPGNSFLLPGKISRGSTQRCVNPLLIGELISTRLVIEGADNITCVNPLHLGELISTGMHFRLRSYENKCVNPLHTGELISTGSTGAVEVNFTSVNPLHTGELISTNGFREWYKWAELCQSPSHWGTHFYRIFQITTSSYLNIVSIPFTPGNSFLR